MGSGDGFADSRVRRAAASRILVSAERRGIAYEYQEIPGPGSPEVRLVWASPARPVAVPTGGCVGEGHSLAGIGSTSFLLTLGIGSPGAPARCGKVDAVRSDADVASRLPD